MGACVKHGLLCAAVELCAELPQWNVVFHNCEQHMQHGLLCAAWGWCGAVCIECIQNRALGATGLRWAAWQRRAVCFAVHRKRIVLWKVWVAGCCVQLVGDSLLCAASGRELLNAACWSYAVCTRWAGVHDAAVFSVCKIGMLGTTGWGKTSMCDSGCNVWYMRDRLLCAARTGCAVVCSTPAMGCCEQKAGHW